MGDFSTRHYHLIAQRLAESKQEFSRLSSAQDGIYRVEFKLMELFEADNPNFDRLKFLTASKGK